MSNGIEDRNPICNRGFAYKVHILISMLMFLVISGCASTPARYASDVDEDGFPVHGNFCGAGVPSFIEEDKEKRIEKLEKIESIDRLDRTCKAHDICYVREGYLDRECDNEFQRDLVSVAYSPDVQGSCRVITAYMLSYFQTSNVGWVTHTVLFEEGHGPVTATILLPFAILGDVWNIIKLAGVLVVKTPFIMLSEAMPGGDDNQMDFPERYEICGPNSGENSGYRPRVIEAGVINSII